MSILAPSPVFSEDHIANSSQDESASPVNKENEGPIKSFSSPVNSVNGQVDLLSQLTGESATENLQTNKSPPSSGIRHIYSEILILFVY